MSLLAGKKALVFGVANKYSIAWAIAEMFKQEGADVGLSYAIPQLEKRVQPLAEELGVTFVEKCDVTSDDEIDAVFEKAGAHFSEIDILVHAIAFAPSNELEGRFYNTSREGFRVAMDISAYSYVALAQRALNLMPNGGSMVTMTYYGAEKVVPHYNVMGVAKAALESSVRYLALNLGPEGIRVNAISAGPIKTLAAAGVGNLRKMLTHVEAHSPLRRNVTIEDVGNVGAFLCSDLAAGVTGEVTYVDGGYNILGMAGME